MNAIKTETKKRETARGLRLGSRKAIAGKTTREGGTIIFEVSRKAYNTLRQISGRPANINRFLESIVFLEPQEGQRLRKSSGMGNANDVNAAQMQEAFKKGFPEFVVAPLREIDANLSKLSKSLGRMDKKLAKITV